MTSSFSSDWTQRKSPSQLVYSDSVFSVVINVLSQLCWWRFKDPSQLLLKWRVRKQSLSTWLQHQGLVVCVCVCVILTPSVSGKQRDEGRLSDALELQLTHTHSHTGPFTPTLVHLLISGFNYVVYFFLYLSSWASGSEICLPEVNSYSLGYKLSYWWAVIFRQTAQHAVRVYRPSTELLFPR